MPETPMSLAIDLVRYESDGSITVYKVAAARVSAPETTWACIWAVGNRRQISHSVSSRVVPMTQIGVLVVTPVVTVDHTAFFADKVRVGCPIGNHRQRDFAARKK